MVVAQASNHVGVYRNFMLMETSNVEVMNRAMDDLKDKWWKDVTYDGWPVTTRTVKCDSGPTPYTDYEESVSFFKLSLTALRNDPQHKARLKSFDFCYNIVTDG